MSTEELIEKIKSKGYWLIQYQPLELKNKINLTKDIIDIVENNFIDYTGWDYPHYPVINDNKQGKIRGSDYVEGWVDYGQYKETWRLYLNGLFIHLIAMREDWYSEDIFQRGLTKQIEPFTKLGFIYVVTAQVTEIFEFASRLANLKLYDEGLTLVLDIEKLQGRELWIENSSFQRQPYIANAENFKFEQTFSKEEILLDSRELACDVILQIVDRFEWNPSKDLILDYQNKVIQKKF